MAFSFGGAATGAAPSFGFGAPAAAASTPAASTTTAPAAGGGLFGAGGFGFGAASTPAATTSTAPAAASTAAPAFGGFGGGFGFGASSAATTTTTAAPAAATTGAADSTSAAPAFGFGAAPAAAAAPAASTAASFGFGTAPATTAAPAAAASAPAFGFGSSAAATTSAAPATTSGALSSSTAPASSSTTAPASSPADGSSSFASSRLRSLNVEELVSLWSRELEDHVRSFVSQAELVSQWDHSMLENFKKIVQLQNQVRNVQLAQTQLHTLLGTIQDYQAEFHQRLDELERGVEAIPQRAQVSGEEMRREEAFRLAEQIDRDLLNMSDTLAESVKSLNASTERSLEPAHPLSAVVKILNVHQDALAWLEEQTQEVGRALQATQSNVHTMQVHEQTHMRAQRLNDYDAQWQR